MRGGYLKEALDRRCPGVSGDAAGRCIRRSVRALKNLRDIDLGISVWASRRSKSRTARRRNAVNWRAELQSAQCGRTHDALDESTAQLKPRSMDPLLVQLNGLVDAADAVIHRKQDMRMVAQCA